MGPSNPIMKKFMEAATTHFLNNLHKVQLEIESNSLEDPDEILEAFECIPDTTADGYFRKMQLLLSYNDNFGVTAMLIQQSEISAPGSSVTPKNHTLAPKYDGPPVRLVTDTPITDTASRNKQKKRIDRLIKDAQERDNAIRDAEDTIKQLIQAAKQNNNQRVVATSLTSNTVNSTNIVQPTPANRMYCLHFSSTKGCKHNKCQRMHAIPPKNSDDWPKIEDLLRQYKLQPTTQFINAK